MISTRRMTNFLAGVGCVLVLSTSAHGAIVTMDGQARSVSTTAGANTGVPDSDSNSDSAVDFSPFNATETSTALSTGALGIGSSAATAEQDSTIAPTLVTAIGETSVVASVNNTGAGSASGTAASLFSYTFTLDSPFQISVLGAVDRFGPVSDAGIELENDSSMTQVFAIGEAVSYVQTAVNTNFVLGAGTYTFLAFADTEHVHFGDPLEPTTAGAEFEFQFTLTPVPEPNSLALLGMVSVIFWGRRRVRFRIEA